MKVYTTSDLILEPIERCISKPPDFGRACLGSSGFHESTTQGHPSIDGGLPPRGRWQYYVVESGQESMAKFNQCFHLLYLASKLLLAQTTCPGDLLWYQESTRLSPSTKKNMLNVPSAKSQSTIQRRGKKLQLQHQHQRSIKYAKRRKETGTKTVLKVHYSL